LPVTVVVDRRDVVRFIDRSKISIALPVGAGSFDAG
jgi:hypothetical protein